MVDIDDDEEKLTETTESLEVLNTIESSVQGGLQDSSISYYYISRK